MKSICRTQVLRRTALLLNAALVFCCASVAAVRPSLLSQATDLGPLDAARSIDITFWMKLHDKQNLDSLVAAQQSGKAGYLSWEQMRARYSPGAADVAKVAEFLKGLGFQVTGAGQENLYVRASGTVALVESALHVDLHRYELHGRTFYASSRSPKLPPELSPSVAGVGGLSNLGAEPQVARATGRASTTIHRPTDAEGIGPLPLALGAQPSGLVFSAECFYAPVTLNFANSANGTSATYQGQRYGAPIASGPPNAPPCGYQPSDLQTAYDMMPLYRKGLNGQGTTIAIVDAFGSTTIAQDVKAFSSNMGLPPANLTILGTPTASNFSPDPNKAGWATETTLDVEWVHAIAPGARIVLVVAPTDSFDDLFNGIVTASKASGVVSISNSWESLEIGVAGDGEFYTVADSILQAIGATGVSVNFSTGDSGDNASLLGGSYTSVGWPASSPYATAVGGVSVALDPGKQIAWQTSWGTTLTEIADTAALGSPPLDPPNNEGFVGGGTGGASDIYAKPDWQQGVPGNRRQIPDISWVADPFTGVEIIFTGDAAGDLFIETVGGTSVSCPMFSALWGIATQAARHPLGQAAPRLYRLPGNAITDVPANPGSAHNVTGKISDPGGVSIEHASELAAPLFNLPSFTSALYNSPFSTRWFVISFGVDSTLSTGPGWDPATGLGTPDGLHFVEAFAGDNDN
jgi:subtilase family serine protease